MIQFSFMIKKNTWIIQKRVALDERDSVSNNNYHNDVQSIDNSSGGFLILPNGFWPAMHYISQLYFSFGIITHTESSHHADSN